MKLAGVSYTWGREANTTYRRRRRRRRRVVVVTITNPA
jgi:hypothetical protein